MVIFSRIFIHEQDLADEFAKVWIWLMK